MSISFFIILIFVSFSQKVHQNYQLRELYYDSNDFVCHYGLPGRKDIIALVLNFEDGSYRPVFADGGTICNDMMKDPWNQVRAVSYWDYYVYDKNYKKTINIEFKQTVKIEYTKFLHRTKSIIANSTLINPVLVDG